jgi:hypothetical protein
MTCLLLASAQLHGQQPPPQRALARVVEVDLNGRRFVDALAVGAHSAGDVFVPVAELARVLDGDPATIGATVAPSRLRLEGSQLHAAAAGGCATCPLRVTRRVVISTRVRIIGGVSVVPLADVVAALEGRVEADPTRTHFVIHAGRCTWCILEPR